MAERINRTDELRALWPAIEVENELVWVNPDFKYFDFKLGQPCHLPVLLLPDRQKPGFPVEITKEHYRTALLTDDTFILDKQGNVYYEIDFKGGGFIEVENFELAIVPFEERLDNSSPRGLADLDCLQYDAKIAEILFKKGIRVVRTMAIAKLLQVFDPHHRLISIDEAKSNRLLLPKRIPAVAFRTFVVRERLENIYNLSQPDCLPIIKARHLIARDLGLSFPKFTFGRYQEWFTLCLAKQLGLMHNLGFVHGYATAHNITLDCRLVDFDSAQKKEDFAFESEFNESVIEEKGIVRDALLSCLLVSRELLTKFDNLYYYHYLFPISA